MLRFDAPIYLWLLLIIPVLVMMRMFVNHRQKKRLKKFGDLKLLKALMPNVSRFRPMVKFGPVSYTHLTLPTILLV